MKQRPHIADEQQKTAASRRERWYQRRWREIFIGVVGAAFSAAVAILTTG